MTTLNNPQGAADAHISPEGPATMTPEPKLITQDGAVYVLAKAPDDPSQLNIDVTVRLHHKLRVAADAHGVTLREFVQDTLAARIEAEEKLYGRA